MKNSPVQGL